MIKFRNLTIYFVLNGGDYHVVELKDEEEVAVVPKQWLNGKDKCLWPSWKSGSRIEKAIWNKEVPDSSFICFMLREPCTRQVKYCTCVFIIL